MLNCLPAAIKNPSAPKRSSERASPKNRKGNMPNPRFSLGQPFSSQHTEAGGNAPRYRDRPKGASTLAPATLVHSQFSLSTVAITLALSSTVQARQAEPVLVGAHFNPPAIGVGQTSALSFTYSNSGSTSVPVGAVELSICPTEHFFEAPDPPKTTGDASFTWTRDNNGCWTGLNSVETQAFGGGKVVLQLKGLAETKQPKDVKIQVRVAKEADRFNNHLGNDQLKVSLDVAASSGKRSSASTAAAADAFPIPFAPWWCFALLLGAAAVYGRRYFAGSRR